MSKILITTYWFQKAGTEVATFALIRELLKHNHDIDLLYVKNEGIMLKELPDEVNLVPLQFIKAHYGYLVGQDIQGDILKKFLIKVYCKLIKIRLIQKKNYKKFYDFLLTKAMPIEKRYDFVFDVYGYGNFLTAFCCNSVVCKKRALWFHDENMDPFARTRDYFDKYDRLFCVSNAVKQSFLLEYPTLLNKVEVLHNFIDINMIRKKSRIKDDLSDFVGKNKILTVGRLANQKGIDRAIEAAKILKDSGVNFVWYVIGQGDLKNQYLNLIRKNQLENNFVLLGLKENPYVYMANCDLYVQPSRHEGYAITLIEAKALMCPIVASDIPSNREQIIDKVNGYLAKDIKELVICIKSLLNDNNKRNSLVEILKKEEMSFISDYNKIDTFIRDIM